MKLLLVYTPFCAPTVAPYSITYLKDFLLANSGVDVACLDLNAKFHRLKFGDFYNWLEGVKSASLEEYGDFLGEFDKASRPVYTANNKTIVDGNLPEFFEEILSLILSEKPDVVGFSLVYNSQAFYALFLIKELKKKGVACVIGGPAVNSIISKEAIVLKDEHDLLSYLNKNGVASNPEIMNGFLLDFSVFPKDDYLSRERILPFKTSRGCFYKQCAFCTHHTDEKYSELDLECISQSIAKNDAKHVFFIDDMISRKRLLELGQVLKDKDVSWWCQLRPSKDLIGILSGLKESGLKSIAWGVESGSQRVLDMMRKGTKVEVIEQLLEESHVAGIYNIVYVMFGFPGETKEDFLSTLDFLKKNSSNIDMVSTSLFGLQKESIVFKHPEKFNIAKILCEKRTVLDHKITYLVSAGLSSEDAAFLRKKYASILRRMNRFPPVFNYLKEQMLLANL